MAIAPSLLNHIAVQLFRRVPWLASRWAKTHRFIECRDVPWTPPSTPVSESAIALVTTAGVHLRSQEPFDMDDPDGDPSFRVIPSTSLHADLTITHKYYDHSAADRDINVVLPLDRARALAAEGRIGGLASFVYGLMGHIDGRHLKTLVEETAPEVARCLKHDRADAVVLIPA